jgi:hypothetical protein
MREQLKSFGTLNPPGKIRIKHNRILLPVGKDLLAGNVKVKLTVDISSKVVFLPTKKSRTRNS